MVSPIDDILSQMHWPKGANKWDHGETLASYFFVKEIVPATDDDAGSANTEESGGGGRVPMSGGMESMPAPGPTQATPPSPRRLRRCRRTPS